MRFDSAKMTQLREGRKMSLHQLYVAMIRTGWSGTEQAVRNLEAGSVGFPNGDTLAALAAVLGTRERLLFAEGK